MMIARANSKHGPMLLLGLSRKNIERLIEGHPIHISVKTHGPCVPPGITIGILFGETEADMHRMLEAADAIDQRTIITTDQRLNDEGPAL